MANGIDVERHPEVIRGLKEQMCSISQHYIFDMQNSDDPISVEDRSYELPNGDIIQVDHKKRFSSTEILFNPNILGLVDENN